MTITNHSNRRRHTQHSSKYHLTKARKSSRKVVKFSPIKRRKRVRFGSDSTETPLIETHSVPSFKTEDLWYKSAAYESFRQERNQILWAVRHHHCCYGSSPRLLLENGSDSMKQKQKQKQPEHHCLTGFEDRMTMEQIIRRRNKTRHYTRAVLQQQYAQRCMGINDPEFLSTVAGMVSRSCGYRARHKASLPLLVIWVVENDIYFSLSVCERMNNNFRVSYFLSFFFLLGKKRKPNIHGSNVNR